MGVSAHRRAVALTAMVVAVAAAAPARADYKPGIPPAVDPGTPVFTGSEQPVPAEPAAFEPGKSRLEAIYQADLAAGGTSFWFDRVLERPFLSQPGLVPLHARPRAVHVHPQRRACSASATATPTASARRAPTRRCTRSRSPASPSRRRPPSAASTRATGAATHTATGLSVGAAQVHHAQQRRGDDPDGHEHRHGADHAHADRRLAGRHHAGRARHRADRRGHRPLRADHDHAAAERRGLHRQRHVADP